MDKRKRTTLIILLGLLSALGPFSIDMYLPGFPAIARDLDTTIAVRKKEIPHEFRIHDGGHSWTYWRNALPTVLNFVSEAFHQY